MPVIQKTKLGWILAGNLPNSAQESRDNVISSTSTVHRFKGHCYTLRQANNFVNDKSDISRNEKFVFRSRKRFPTQKGSVNMQESLADDVYRVLSDTNFKSNKANFAKRRKDYSCQRVGEIVLIKEDNLPPMSWRLGKILEVHPGKDGKVRVVTLKTMHGMFKRPIHKLARLLKD